MKRKLALLGAVLAVLGMAATARPQTATGQITGTVKDATGAVVPGATVTVTSELTGSKREATTGKDGNFVDSAAARQHVFGDRVAPGLPPRQADRRSPERRSGRARRPGPADRRADRGRRGAGRRDGPRQRDRERRPGHHREADHGPSPQRAQLHIAAVPGRGRRGDRRASREPCGRASGNAISIMGARPTSNNFMIDGTANIDTALGTPAAILSVDALEEFKEQTKTYSAEYGFSANQINLVSKSGTNECHGALFWFGRDEALDAKNFFDPPNAEKPKLDQKQFGGVVGGPIIKDKTFFLVNYEGARIDRGSSTFFLVPTRTSWRAGSPRRSSTRSPASRSRTTPSPRRATRASRKLTLQNEWYPAPNTGRAPRQLLRSCGRFPRRRTSSRSGSTRTWAGSAGPSAATRRRRTRTGRRRVTPEHRGPDLHPEHQELAGLPHLAHPEQRRQLVPRRPRLGRRANQERHRVCPVGHRLPAV